MEPAVTYHLKHVDKHTGARLGELVTPHGTFPTPMFMPVGTLASVKTMAPEELDEMGVCHFVISFEEVRNLTSTAFLEEILVKRLKAKAVCCGYDYRFGHDGADAVQLKALCDERANWKRQMPCSAERLRMILRLSAGKSSGESSAYPPSTRTFPKAL